MSERFVRPVYGKRVILLKFFDADDRLKRLACKDVIEYILKQWEIEDLEKRIDTIERRLAEKQH